jgi:hypothetical protein
MIHHVTAEFVCVCACVLACIMPDMGYEKWDIKPAFTELITLGGKIIVL